MGSAIYFTTKSGSRYSFTSQGDGSYILAREDGGVIGKEGPKSIICKPAVRLPTIGEVFFFEYGEKRMGHTSKVVEKSVRL